MHLNIAREVYHQFNAPTKYMDHYSIHRVYLITEFYFLVTVLSSLISLPLLLNRLLPVTFQADAHSQCIRIAETSRSHSISLLSHIFLLSIVREMYITWQIRVAKNQRRNCIADWFVRRSFALLHVDCNFTSVVVSRLPTFLSTLNLMLPESCLWNLYEITTRPELYSEQIVPGVSLRVSLRFACHILNQPATARSKSARKPRSGDVTHILDSKC